MYPLGTSPKEETLLPPVPRSIRLPAVYSDFARLSYCDREVAATGVRVLPLRIHFLDILRQGGKEKVPMDRNCRSVQRRGRIGQANGSKT
jgi:hypothetical protein